MEKNLNPVDTNLQYKTTKRWQKIQSIDISKIIKKLKKDTSNEKISDIGYRQFLYLVSEVDRLNLNIDLTPTKEIDEVWHAHILHTKQYYDDCQKALGYFVHHTPSFEENTTEKSKKAFTKTICLANSIFGESSHFLSSIHNSAGKCEIKKSGCSKRHLP